MRRTLLLGLAALASCHSSETHRMLANGDEPTMANSAAPARAAPAAPQTAPHPPTSR